MTRAREVLMGEHSMLVALIDYWRRRSDEAVARSAAAQRAEPPSWPRSLWEYSRSWSQLHWWSTR